MFFLASTTADLIASENTWNAFLALITGSTGGLAGLIAFIVRGVRKHVLEAKEQYHREMECQKQFRETMQKKIELQEQEIKEMQKNVCKLIFVNEELPDSERSKAVELYLKSGGNGFVKRKAKDKGLI